MMVGSIGQIIVDSGLDFILRILKASCKNTLIDDFSSVQSFTISGFEHYTYKRYRLTTLKLLR
jgi:hypothetical protein